MRSLADLARGKSAEKRLLKHPRFKMLDEFYARVNTQRKSENLKPLPMKFFAVKTSHLSLEDMDYLLKRVSQSSHPAKVFFGALKIK